MTAQAANLLYYLASFFPEMLRTGSTLALPWTSAQAAAIGVPAALAASARLLSGFDAEAFAAAALALLAGLVLSHYAVGLAAGRLYRPLTWIFLAGALVLAAAWRLRRKDGPARPSRRDPPLGWWDAGSLAVLATLLIPVFFRYIHEDAVRIWACRAFALDRAPSFDALAGCEQPAYPPGWSLLLWLGIQDPVAQGRLLAWSLLPLFSLFFRARCARLHAGLAAPATFFMLLTFRVWDGAATYYANVPLMVFLVTGTLLALDRPGGAEAASSAVGRRLAAAACLCAAVLMRPDGLYYLLVVALASGALASPPFAAAAAAALSWTFRPAALHARASFFLAADGRWRSAAAGAGAAALKILLVFLNGWQGQWFSHRGFAFFPYLLIGLLVWRHRRGFAASDDARYFGRTSTAFLLSVIACYAAIPFVGDPTLGVCRPGTPYDSCYLHFIRTGLGRMTAHLYPFLLFWALAIIQDGSRDRTGNQKLLY